MYERDENDNQPNSDREYTYIRKSLFIFFIIDINRFRNRL